MKLTVFEKHQLKIVIATLVIPDAILRVIGGMTKEEAHKIIEKLDEAELKEESEKI